MHEFGQFTSSTHVPIKIHSPGQSSSEYLSQLLRILPVILLHFLLAKLYPVVHSSHVARSLSHLAQFWTVHLVHVVASSANLYPVAHSSHVAAFLSHLTQFWTLHLVHVLLAKLYPAAHASHVAVSVSHLTQ